MPFHINSELRYKAFERSSLILNVHALSTAHQSIADESFTVTQGTVCDFFPCDASLNRSVRVDTCDVSDVQIHYSATVETTPFICDMFEVEAVSLAQLDLTVLHYLYPSRYCQSDQMGRIASKHFGHITHPLGRASAVSDWIFENIDYVSGTTDTGTSAYDTVTQRAGVCRDFAHLGIALCRALSIPARYFTGYAWGMQPPDFHACFEVCVGNQWYVFDPTRLSAPNGLIQIATGRDAADSAVASIYGAVQLEWMSVSCTAESFQPIPHEAMAGKALLVEP